MKIYNAIGYTLLLLYCLSATIFAPPEWSFWTALLVGFAYLVLVWFWGGVYLAVILHMGIAHRALDFNDAFIKIVTLIYGTAGIYVNPISWVNRHRHHHIYSDKPGDPNKLGADGFWKTIYLIFFPYACQANLATDSIFKSWTFRLVSNTYFEIFAQLSSFGIIWLLVRDWKYALVLWAGVRVYALYVNMIQNYWTHDRRFGSRRYDDDDNAMNIGDWLPVTSTFSACLQNNHHHYPRFLRLSHDEKEYDFGFLVVRFFKRIGLVEATSAGLRKPKEISLQEVGL
jgi:stearoyl-CoA desaturase (delta-9 desaturase)